MTGTIFKDRGLGFQTLYNTIKGYDIFIDDNSFQKWNGINKEYVLKHYINSDIEYRINETIFPQMLNSFEKNIKKHYFTDNCIELVDPKLPELFSNIRYNGIKIVLNTSYSSEIQEKIINKLGLNNYIDDYISSHNMLKGKTEPLIIQELMKRSNIKNPNQVIKIGDSIYDMFEGKNAKCNTTIGVLTGINNEKELIDSGSDLILNNIMDLKYYF